MVERVWRGVLLEGVEENVEGGGRSRTCTSCRRSCWSLASWGPSGSCVRPVSLGRVKNIRQGMNTVYLGKDEDEGWDLRRPG